MGFYAWVTHDVTSDSVPFWVPPPRTARALSTTRIVVSTLACIASSDRHSVALALSSSLLVAGPFSLAELWVLWFWLVP